MTNISLIKLLDSQVHTLYLTMQAAHIEWKHGGGAEVAMQWIENTLFGPGLIPDESEPYGTQAQEYFDANHLIGQQKGKENVSK